MLNKYAVLIRMKWVEMFEYRAESVIWVIGAITQPLVTLAVWLGISDGGDIQGFSANHFILYFVGLIFVERMTTAWDIWDLDREIRQGTFSFPLLRPLHPVHWAVAENVVYKVFFLSILLPLWAVAAIYIEPLRVSLSGMEWLAFLIAVLFGLGIRFLMGWCIGLLGFWFSRVVAIYGVVEGISLFFSGRIAPLSIMPPMVQRIGEILPFSYILYFPVEILMGEISQERLVTGFIGQMVWLVVLFGLFQILWKAGLKAYSAAGG